MKTLFAILAMILLAGVAGAEGDDDCWKVVPVREVAEWYEYGWKNVEPEDRWVRRAETKTEDRVLVVWEEVIMIRGPKCFSIEKQEKPQKPKPCPYRFRAVPADEAEAWSAKNPGWEPFTVCKYSSGETTYLGWQPPFFVWFKRRVCEGE